MKLRTIPLVLALIGVPVLLLIGLVRLGEGIPPNAAPGLAPTAVEAAAPTAEAAAAPSAAPGPQPIVTLIVQIMIIIGLSRLVAVGMMKLKQPRVVGEIAAGLLLGPSLLGVVAPGLFATLFPAASLGALGLFANIGVVLFMFLVGLEFDPKLLAGQGASVAVTSHASIAVPFLMGVALAFALFEPFAPAGVEFTSFALFIGAAMSVTAFPVLARILSERGLTATRMGVVALGCAAICNAAAWLILAAVTVLVRSSQGGMPLWLNITSVLAFTGLVLFGIRPLLTQLHARYPTPGWLTQNGVAFMLMLMLLLAWATHVLGLHALFGGFLAGLVIPRDPVLTRDLVRRLEDLTVIFLLPLYFAYTGLRTSFGALGDLQAWVWVLFIVAVAVAGKIGGATIAARFTGSSWRDAGAIGVLMNTRALMELIIINMALDLGVISTELFSMLVIMALATTAMTTPLLDWLYTSPSKPEPQIAVPVGAEARPGALAGAP